jgi:hypothetical protein
MAAGGIPEPLPGSILSGELELRKHPPFFIGVALLFAAAAAAQTGHITPFTGTWKLNLKKSRFNPGPPFKSFTLTFAPDGTRNLNLVGADGQPVKASLPWSDGKEVSVAAGQGMANATAVSKIRGKTFDDTWKENEKIVEKVHGVVSRNGRTLTITIDGTDRQDRPFHNQLIFEKQ